MITDEIRETLFSLRDEGYKSFQVKLIPTVSPDSVIGVRTPELRKLAKEYAKRDDIDTFLRSLPHKYFDEDQLHAFIISNIKDYEICMKEVKLFLPYINNWATCDQLSPQVFKKHRNELLDEIKLWIRSDEIYIVRFGLGMLMQHFLEEDFDPSYLEMAAKLRSDEYYVNMMIAWYFATALAKQYDEALPYIEGRKLSLWTHNKAIQKAVESYRISPKQKEYLKELRIKKTK